MNRRQFNRTALLAGGAALFGEAAFHMASPRKALAQNLPSLPDPDASGIEHIVVVCMENRSFDHFLGWVPNAKWVGAPAVTLIGPLTPVIEPLPVSVAVRVWLPEVFSVARNMPTPLLRVLPKGGRTA